MLIGVPKEIKTREYRVAMTPAGVRQLVTHGHRVLVQHIEEKEQVRGGIIIPDSAKEKPQEAKVIALGTGKRDESGKVTPFEVKVGDKVLISKYGGTEVKVDDQKFTLVREDDILGVIA